MNPAAAILALFGRIGAAAGRLGPCAQAGLVAGVYAGFFVQMTLYAHDPAFLGWAEQAALALGSAGFSTAVLVTAFGAWLRYGVGAVFLPLLVNALVVSVLTVAAGVWVGNPVAALAIGAVTGVLVGALLCRACAAGPDREGVR